MPSSFLPEAWLLLLPAALVLHRFLPDLIADVILVFAALMQRRQLAKVAKAKPLVPRLYRRHDPWR